MSAIYLCHKCGGVLNHNGGDERLYSCQCISGWVRDWQHPSVNPRAEQVEHTQRWIELFTSQGREPSYFEPLYERMSKLKGTT